MNWNKCEDQLPKMDELVLICNPEDDHWDVTVGELAFSGWRVLNALGVIECTGYFSLKTFTHWMPLPEKPTE